VMKAIVKHTKEPHLNVNIEIPSAGPVKNIESKNGKTAYAKDNEEDASFSFGNSKEWIE